MLNFWSFLESMSATTSGTGVNTPINNDDGGDDNDDENYSWDNIKKNYGKQIQDWADNSLCAKKIKGQILEKVFSVKPKVKHADIYTTYDTGYAEPEGTLEQGIVFRHPDNFEDFVLGSVRNASKCDLWKYLKIPAENIWSMADKGYMSQYIYHTIVMCISGINIQQLGQPKTSPSWGQDYMRSHSNWIADKLTIQKYGRFIAEKYEKAAENRAKRNVASFQKNPVNDNDIELYLNNIKVRDRSIKFDIEVVFIYDYKVVSA